MRQTGVALLAVSCVLLGMLVLATGTNPRAEQGNAVTTTGQVRLPFDPPWEPGAIVTAPPPRPTIPPLFPPPEDLPLAPGILSWQDSGHAYRLHLGQEVTVRIGPPYGALASSNTAVLQPRFLAIPTVSAAHATTFTGVGIGWATLSSLWSPPPCRFDEVCIQRSAPVRWFSVSVRVDP